MDGQALQLLEKYLKSLHHWQHSFGEWNESETLRVDNSKLEAVFETLAERLKGNYPFANPGYAGQMMKPPHQIAWAAYALAMSINPNNHALDGGPPSSEMEKEVVAELAKMVGYDENYLGHLTSGGTVANLEALWVARQTHPGKKIAFSANAHYTHERMCGVLGVESVKIGTIDGQFDLAGVNPEEIGTIVVTLGTTGLGDVEPLSQILAWAKENNIRIHIDAAYGGFYKLISKTGLIDPKSWNLMHEADSIVIDPHKHGLQPYGCGSVLFKSAEVGKFYKHDSPYTYFTSDELHLGEISLECSRAGASAVAFWAILQCFPLKEDEGFGPIMQKCRTATLQAYELMKTSTKLKAFKKPELDILGYFPVKPETKTTSEISELSKKVFQKGMDTGKFYLSLFKVPASEFVKKHSEYTADTEQVTILRSVFMKPEHADFVEELISRIEECV